MILWRPRKQNLVRKAEFLCEKFPLDEVKLNKIDFQIHEVAENLCLLVLFLFDGRGSEHAVVCSGCSVPDEYGSEPAPLARAAGSRRARRHVRPGRTAGQVPQDILQILPLAALLLRRSDGALLRQIQASQAMITMLNV